jgi:hypothetical protein
LITSKYKPLLIIKTKAMSKRCYLQKEYHKEYGNYKGDGKYSDHYVKWLESRILELTIPVVVSSSSLKNENSKLNDVEFYDLMQMYRMAEITDQEKTVKRFEAVKEWIRLNYA